jgi:hypothetical protein
MRRSRARADFIGCGLVLLAFRREVQRPDLHMFASGDGPRNVLRAVFTTNELSESGTFSRSMPKMQDFNSSPVLVQTIVDVEWRMEKPPQLRISFYGSADVRKGLKQFDMVEKIIGESPGCFGMLLPRPLENFLQIG